VVENIMPTVDVVNERNDTTGQVDLPAAIFAGVVNKPLLHEVTTLWLRNQRAGTVSTKGRSEVSGGGKKPWKQKGTGRARAGSSRSPLWVGGGTIHGPKPREFDITVPRKKRRVALASALSWQFKEGNIVVVDGLEMEEPKTARMAGFLKLLGMTGEKVLVVVPRGSEIVEKSTRNIANVMVITPEALNPYLVLYHRKVIFFKSVLNRIEEVFG
jgi:large subunit ribosomal protein L4